MLDKAYKILSINQNISHNKAKSLIDAGLVSANGQKIILARTLLDKNTKFSILKQEKPKIIFEDNDILAVDKPPFMASSEIEKMFKFKLLNRLDKGTSGVIMLSKNEHFRALAISEFEKLRVKKIYLAIVKGIISEKFSICEPILSIKSRFSTTSIISKKGKEAISEISPLMISAKKSLIKIAITTGRTHQIRVHLANANFPIIGDEKYGKNSSKRMFLHSYQTEIFSYKFSAPLSDDFNEFGFEIPKNLEI